jgi:hypothetical protein
VIRTTFLFATGLTIASPVSGLAQQLILSSQVGKTAFFEGEPIYLLVRLQNLGADTAWVTFFGLGTQWVPLSVSRGDGTPVPVGTLYMDYRVSPTWRGEPLAPGASIVNTQVLQDFAGDQWNTRNHLFTHHLSPDQYEVHVEFAAHAGVPRTTPLLVRAAPISFRIRERTAAEEAEVAELESMQRMGADTTRIAGYPRAAGYKAALIDWVERRVRVQPDDPFLPFLLYNGLYGVGEILWKHIQAGEVRRFDPDTSEVVSRLRLAVIETDKLSTAGAHLVQGLTARHSDQLAVLAEQLKATPAGEMARYQVERNQHHSPFERQPPR